MMYEFQAEDGRVIEVDRPMADAPDLGEPLEFEGATYRRIYSDPVIPVDSRNGSIKWPRFESHQLPRNWTHHKGDFSPSGKPRFTSQEEVTEACARAADEGTEIAHGEL